MDASGQKGDEPAQADVLYDLEDEADQPEDLVIVLAGEQLVPRGNDEEREEDRAEDLVQLEVPQGRAADPPQDGIAVYRERRVGRAIQQIDSTVRIY